MPKTLWNKTLAPLPGEDLLEAFEQFLSQPGRIIPVASIAAAGVLLDQAQAQDVTINASNPAEFSIGSSFPVHYTCVGKDADGDWDMVPVNEVEAYEQTRAGANVKVVLNAGQKSLGFKSPLPARPYDRVVTAAAHAVYFNVTGIVMMELSMNNSLARARVSSGDNETTSLNDMCIIPAGVTPDIQLNTVGHSAGSTHSWWTDPAMNRLVVEAKPKRMKA